MTPITISYKSLLQKFQVCEPRYINKICKGRCCEGINKLLITIHPKEKERIKNFGGVIEDNFLINKNYDNKCFFKKENLCTIHDNKPYGCLFSPFTLSKKDTLIVRNRYRLLRCYNTKDAVFIYIAHKNSLLSIVGEKNYNLICKNMKNLINKNFDIYIEDNIYNILKDNDKFKKSI